MIWPLPALTTVSPPIVNAPVCARSVTLPESAPKVARPMSASSPSVKPPWALNSTDPWSTITADARLIEPPLELNVRLFVPVVPSVPSTSIVPAACTAIDAPVVDTICVIVTALASNKLIAPPARMSRLSASMVALALLPRLTAPVADSVTLPAWARLAMLMLLLAPVATKVRSPTVPVIAPMAIEPLLINVRLPPAIAIELTVRLPVCVTLKSPSPDIVTCSVPTCEVIVRSSRAVTVKLPAVTLPPKVMPWPALSVTVPALPTSIAETTTRSPVVAAKVMTSGVASFGWVGRLTTVRLPVAA